MAMYKMTSLVVILASCWFLGDAATVTRKNHMYEDVGLNNKAFADNITFESPAKHDLDCALQCSQRDSCVAFTFHENTCRGHSSLMTSSSNFSPVSEARSYSRKARCEKTGVTRVIDPSLGLDMNVYCQDDWMVFQKRLNGSVDFYRDWAEYSTGFGDVNGEYWLGLDTLHRITTSGVAYELRVDLMTSDGTNRSALYSNFFVGSAADKYSLNYDSFLSGALGDALLVSRGKSFTTRDADNDVPVYNCAVSWHGAWWYAAICGWSNLNGDYTGTGYQRILWLDHVVSGFYHAKSCQMMIRPAN